MNNWTELPQGESKALNRVLLQVGFIATIGLLLGVVYTSYSNTDYLMTVETLLLMALATHFIRKKMLFNHGFEKIAYDNTSIKHQIFRWIFFSTTSLKREEIEHIQLMNIRKREKDPFPEYFSDYRIEISLTKDRKYYIGNFISKEEAAEWIKKLK